MEHVFQIGVNFDDEALEKAILDQATKKVTEVLLSEVRSQVFKITYSGSILGLSQQSEAIIKSFLEDYKDDIIDRVVESLIGTIKNSKRYKETIRNTLQEG